MDDLLAEFVAESREMIETIGSELVAWEANPTDRARLDAIFRVVHTIKGNCGFFDLPRLESLSHAAEDALGAVRAGERPASAALVTAILAIIDRIGVMIDAIAEGADPPSGDDAALVAALDRDVPLPAANGASSPERTEAQTLRSIRVALPLLDTVMASVSDLVLARNELARCLRGGTADPVAIGALDRLSAILDRTREDVTRMRMQRMDVVFGGLPRLVRDLAVELGKDVILECEGGAVELDRELVAMIRDPLTHIVRNALDHGIENAAERKAAGKPAAGTLGVSAQQTGNFITVTVTDDGRGIDRGALISRAVAAGIIAPLAAETLSDEAVCALIFTPGLSTARGVTAISGRGVGMDAVRDTIERIGGSIAVSSVPGSGTRIQLRLPLTLSIVASLAVAAGGQTFALPLSSVREIIRAGSCDANGIFAGGRNLVTVRGERLARANLGQILAPGTADSSASGAMVILGLGGGERLVLAVDRVIDHIDLVVKPLPPGLLATGFYAGASLMDDGAPILLLDAAGLAAAAAFEGREARPASAPAPEADAVEVAAAGEPALLFLDRAGRRRIVRAASVARIETVPAEAIVTAGEGDTFVRIGDVLLPLAGHRSAPVAGASLTLLRLTDGNAELALAIDQVIAMTSLSGQIAPVRVPGETEGSIVVDGEAAEVVDLHWLFAAHAAPAPAAPVLTCLVPADDPWARTILTPLIVAAGYAVVDESHPGPVDLVIDTDAPGVPRAWPGADTIALTLDAAGGGAGGVYRYDRAGIVAALAAVRARRAA